MLLAAVELPAVTIFGAGVPERGLVVASICMVAGYALWIVKDKVREWASAGAGGASKAVVAEAADSVLTAVRELHAKVEAVGRKVDSLGSANDEFGHDIDGIKTALSKVEASMAQLLPIFSAGIERQQTVQRQVEAISAKVADVSATVHAIESGQSMRNR